MLEGAFAQCNAAKRRMQLPHLAAGCRRCEGLAIAALAAGWLRQAGERLPAASPACGLTHGRGFCDHSSLAVRSAGQLERPQTLQAAAYRERPARTASEHKC